MALATAATTVAMTSATGLAALFGGAPSVASAAYPSCLPGQVQVLVNLSPITFICATVFPAPSAGGSCPNGEVHISVPGIVDVCVVE